MCRGTGGGGGIAVPSEPDGPSPTSHALRRGGGGRRGGAEGARPWGTAPGAVRVPRACVGLPRPRPCAVGGSTNKTDGGQRLGRAPPPGPRGGGVLRHGTAGPWGQPPPSLPFSTPPPNAHTPSQPPPPPLPHTEAHDFTEPAAVEEVPQDGVVHVRCGGAGAGVAGGGGGVLRQRHGGGRGGGRGGGCPWPSTGTRLVGVRVRMCVCGRGGGALTMGYTAQHRRPLSVVGGGGAPSFGTALGEGLDGTLHI